MKSLITLYVIAFGLVWLYCGFQYLVVLYIFSAIVAAIPVAIRSFWVIAPLLALFYCWLFGDNNDIFTPTFATLACVFAPFYWLSMADIIVSFVKWIIGD